MIRVCLVDDQNLVRQGIRSLLALDDGIGRILDSLPAHIALVDNAGRIVSVNKAWRDFADANGLPTGYTPSGTFGRGTATTHYPRPRPGMTGGRTFLAALGVRF